MKARLLRKLRIRRVDLVSDGANQCADVMLFKSAEKVSTNNPEQENMSADQSAGGVEEMTETVELVKKLQGDVDAATKLAEEEAEKREAVEKAYKIEMESLKKRLDEQEAQIQKARDAAELVEFVKVASAFEHLPIKPEAFGVILRKCSKALDKTEYEELSRILKSADAASSPAFAEIGLPGANTELRTAAEELYAKAEELVTKSAGKLTEADAMSQAMKQNPRLAARYRAESYSRSSS